MTIRMQQRRDSAANWTGSPVILASGEIGVETDTGRIKVGNGSDIWTALPYSTLSEFKTSAAWGSYASVIALGKICFDSDSPFFKVGDGASTWSELDYFKPASAILGDVGIDFDTLEEIQDLLLGGTANQVLVTPDPDGTPVWSNTLTDIQSLDFNTAAGTSGLAKIAYDDTLGTLEFGLKGGNVTLHIGQGQVLRVRNATGSTLAKGTVVYINGSNGTNFNVAKALADSDATSAQTIGVLAEELNTSSTQHGFAMTYGLIPGVDLSYISGLANGDMLFLDPSTAGRLTKTKPSGPDHLVYMGYCLSANSGGSNATIFVKPQNGYELNEIHDVKVSSLAHNDILTYDKTTDPTNPVWVNKNSVNVTGTVNASTLRATSTDGATLSTTAIITGSPTGQHIGISGASIVSMSGASTAGNLYIQPNANSYITLGSTTSTIDMVGTIASGNVIAAGDAGAAALQFTAGSNTFIPVAGAFEYDGTISTFTPNTSFGRAPIATPIFTSGVGTSGIAATTAYPLFAAANDTITLPIGTYKIDLSVRMLLAGSTVSSAFPFALRGIGTAVGSYSWDGTGSITDGGAANQFNIVSGAITSITNLTAASTVSGRVYLVRGGGILKITQAGTIIPSYYWSGTMTSGTVTLYADNYMMITPLASSSVTSTGSWA